MENIVATFTPAQVGGGSDVMLDSIDNVDTAHLPLYVTWHLDKGDAYTVDPDCKLQITDEDGNVHSSIPAVGFLDQTTEKKIAMRAATSGGKFIEPNYIFYLHATHTVTKGTASGNLRVRMFFERVPLR